MNKKKKIITIILVLLVVLLGGASVYVATQLSTRKAVAPTAPESKPKAFETCGAGLSCDSIQATGSTQCTDSSNSGDRYCCPLGQVISNGACVDEWQGCDACTVTGVASEVVVDLIKMAYLNVSTNTTNRSLMTKETGKTGDLAVVKKGETFVFGTVIENKSTATVSGIVFSDTLKGDNLEKLTFKDAYDGCRYDETTRVVSCDPINLGPGAYNFRVFRVTVANDVADGVIIKNTGLIKYGDKTKNASYSLTVKNDAEVVKAVLEGSKTTFKNVTSNTSGNYGLTTMAETVSKSQIYVYTIELKNTSTATASGVVIKDSLANMPVTYMDAVAGCSYSASSLEVTCNTSIKPSETKKFSFRVKASDGVANGTEISNTAKVTYPDGSLDLSKNSTVSTVVGCNHTCTTVEECSTGLTCDTTTSKCRTSACLTEDDCTCTVAVVPTVTRAVTRTGAVTATSTIAPTKVVTQTEEEIAEATPTILPETGIFDLPGIVAFGGGLLLAVVGILLAL